MSLVRAGLGAYRKSPIEVWAVLAGPKTPQTGGPRSGPPVGGVLGPAEAAQTRKVDDFRSAPGPSLTEDTVSLGTHIRRSVSHGPGQGNRSEGLSSCKPWAKLQPSSADAPLTT